MRINLSNIYGLAMLLDAIGSSCSLNWSRGRVLQWV